MPKFDRTRTLTFQLGLICLTGVVAYIGARLAQRPTSAAIVDLATAVSYTANRVKIDYWRIYEDVQKDLLDTEQR